MRGLAEAPYDLTAAAFEKGDKSDERLLVQFSMYPHPDRDATAKEGRPMFKEVLYVMIMVPGDKDSIVHRPAWEKDFQRFPRQYQAFQNKKAQESVAGTPLRSVGFLTLGQIKELEYFNCYTVEQLANMSDANTSKFIGIQKLKQLANDFLTAAKEAAPLTAIRAEIEKRENELAAANNAINEQSARIKALEALVAKMGDKEKK